MEINGISENWIPYQSQGRVLSAEPRESATGILIGLHGYGENAEIQMARLRAIPGAARWHLVSPQAAHLFYRRNADVVASWMTKQNREAAIESNVQYLSEVVRIARETAGADKPLVWAGFSQGASMAYRAALHCGTCAGLIILAGDIPPEMRGGALDSLPPILLARGKSDRVVSGETIARDLELLQSRKADVEQFEFDGGHEWHETFLQRAGEFLATISNDSNPPAS